MFPCFLLVFGFGIATQPLFHPLSAEQRKPSRQSPSVTLLVPQPRAFVSEAAPAATYPGDPLNERPFGDELWPITSYLKPCKDLTALLEARVYVLKPQKAQEAPKTSSGVGVNQPSEEVMDNQ